MDQPHPFSPPNLHQPFPLSFFEEDMLLFTGGSSHGGVHDLTAWENMGIGQGRSVSSLMDPYHLDLQAQAAAAGAGTGAAATSPPLHSPMDTTGGFNSRGAGGKKRGSNVDVLGNPLPLPSSILLSHHHHNNPNYSNSNKKMERNPPKMRRKSSSSSSSSGSSGKSVNSIHNNAILVSEAGDMGVFDHHFHHQMQQHQQQHNNHHHHHNLNLTTLHFLDAMDMTSNTNVIIEEDDEDERSREDEQFLQQQHQQSQSQSSRPSNGLSQPQKRRRKDTSTPTVTAAAAIATNNGSNTDDLSSNDDDTGSGNDGRRRESLVDGKRPERPRLTETEKKNNHIASEQKRRMAIRDGFDRLTELVPGIEGQGRSESVVLRKTVDYMRKAIEDRRNLIARVQELGGEVPQDLLLR